MLQQGCRELEALGFKARYRTDIGSSFRYFAGPDQRRLDEFIEMLVDPDIHAIFCARGGYGSGHLLPRIDPAVIRKNPKIICGASDITLVLNFVERAGLVAFHGPMVATSMRQGTEGYDRTKFLELLTGVDRVRFPMNGTEVLRAGSAEGRLTGGCLSLVTAGLGTTAEVDTRDAIVVLEDVDAKPYQIDRMITQLKQSGKFDHVRGVVFGEMLNCSQHSDQGYTLQEVVLDLLAEFDFPILYGYPTGHTSRPNVIVPFGVQARLELKSTPTFELLEPAVALR
jgi:muramoyltetrapeptide carboxypeptidase